MNKLPLETRVQILSMLVEGSSLRSISRITGTSINTVTKLLVDAGKACIDFHDEKVRNVTVKKVQADKIWSFCYAKQKNVAKAKAAPEGSGNVWTWSAIEGETKLMLTWFVGTRDGDAAYALMCDLRDRMANLPQLTTDGFAAYRDAIGGAFGDKIDYATLVKVFAPTPAGPGRYSPPACVGSTKNPVFGNPDLKHVSTSYAERQHLTMRMQMRRFTRLTNAFSKKFENHCHSLALYFVFYNWVRKHKAHGTTPAIAAKLTDKAMTFEDIVALIDARAEKELGDKRRAMLSADPLGKVSHSN
jgi:IS1 family transposase